jgi:hypothetical protein
MKAHTQQSKALPQASVLRVIDANVNRLREALRVMEEYYRFIIGQKTAAQQCKKLRHSLAGFERAIGRACLLQSRNTVTDPFARADHAETQRRKTIEALFIANCKRGQEAARALEEYCKVPAGFNRLVTTAKHIRFTIYKLEKKSCI